MASLDVKYTVGTGSDHNLDPFLVTPHEDLEPRGRRSLQKVPQLRSSQEQESKVENQKGDAENIPNDCQQRARSRSVRKAKAKKKRSPITQQQQQHKLKSPTFSKSGGVVKKQFARLNALISPLNQKSRQQPPFFSPETAYAQNHRHRPIHSDVPSEVILYANAGDSPESLISMSTFLPPLDDAEANTSRSIIRNAARLAVCDTSMDVDDVLDENKDDRKMSPTFARLMEARTMATGQANLSLSYLEQISDSKDANSVQLDYDVSMESSKELDVGQKPWAHLTLPQVWDDSYRKARKFIVDVVSGADCGTKEDEAVAPTEIAKDERMDQFCTQLREVLIDSNAMIETTELAGIMSDFTDSEVDEFLTKLAAQDKIMLAGAWIYRI